MKDYIIFRCDHDNSTVVSVRVPERGTNVFMGVAECPDMHTAMIVMDALREREAAKGGHDASLN